MPEVTALPSLLSTRRGKLILILLCSVALLDFVDTTIVNVALPTIRFALHMPVQNLQWIPSAYLLTYGGFMLLGARAADLLGRRRVLVAGTSLFGLASIIGGLAGSSGVLIAARLAQGGGAAMMLPAALSILTTTFNAGGDRHKALGAWRLALGAWRLALGAWRLGRRSRACLRIRSTARWRPDPGSRLALGVLCQSPDLPPRARRDFLADLP
jgi:MFS family permease